MYAHTPGRDLAFFNNHPNLSVWQYVPMQAGEKIVEMWLRRMLRDDDEPEVALALIVCASSPASYPNAHAVVNLLSLSAAQDEYG